MTDILSKLVMDRNNHYEAAFEAYLQHAGYGFIAVDETHRSWFAQETLKSIDFVVFAAGGGGLLVDVKGRQFPAGPPSKQRRVWESWVTEEDVTDLDRWRDYFGPGYQPLLVFSYLIHPDVVVAPRVEDLWIWRDNRYLLRAISTDDYRLHMRRRSPRWKTVDLPSDVFRSTVRPFRCFAQSAVEECPF